ncbi:WAP four-disulfide core domain protein 18-like [Epargyreus clarus]|uniref:WAP four-disulfide core domain protein 18-like n=1 Tax=Epargyreus clarus TaxID=520877 RepID=UPI003C2AC2A5
MFRYSLIFLVLAITVVHCNCSERPGSCPIPKGAGTCDERCSGDSSCPQPQKCCSNGCGHHCMQPIYNFPETERPGSCPPVQGPGACVELCSDDSSCPQPQKCCSIGCGHDCKQPIFYY